MAASRLGIEAAAELVADAAAIGRGLGLTVDDPVVLKDSLNLRRLTGAGDDIPPHSGPLSHDAGMAPAYARVVETLGERADPSSGKAKAVALSYILPAIGFGIPTPFVLRYLARTHELPMTPFGFRSHSGPFEALGRDRFIALGGVLMVSCLIDVFAGTLLWRGRQRGAILGVGATPLTLLMAYGFAFPFLLLAIPIRLVLTARAWSTLR